MFFSKGTVNAAVVASTTAISAAMFLAFLPAVVHGAGHISVPATVRYKGTVTVTNNAPAQGICLTPPWVGVHQGDFDTYNGGEALPTAFETLVEDGNNADVIAAFAAANGTDFDGTVGSGPLCAGDSATYDFDVEIPLNDGTARYFSYASMILPSNDAWTANGNPMAYEIFAADTAVFTPLTIQVPNSQILDAGTEVNDELPANTAFFGQAAPNTGVTEVGGTVQDHPGFNAVGTGGILDDPDFVNADFTVDPTAVFMTITVTANKVTTFDGYITVQNMAPANGTCVTPPWVGIHDGTFDTYNGDEALPPAFEALVEDGNNANVLTSFAAAPGGVWDGTVGTGPICPGEMIDMVFSVDVMEGTTHYFSYASMILPSNDAWVSNGNPLAYTVFEDDGTFAPVTVMVAGTDVLDAGTEVNDEDPANTAFFGQATPNTGTDENSVVIDHPGFNAVGSGGILDAPQFSMADFTAADYQVMTIMVTMDKVLMTAEPTSVPTMVPTGMPIESGAAGIKLGATMLTLSLAIVYVML